MIKIRFVKRAFLISFLVILLQFIILKLLGVSTMPAAVLSVPIILLGSFRIELSLFCGKIYEVLYWWGVCFYTLFLSQLALNVGMEMLSLKRIILNVIIVSFIGGIIYLVKADSRFAITIASGIVMLLTTANYFVVSFRGSELDPSDFLSFRTALNVVGTYKFTYDVTLIYAWMLFTYLIWQFGSIRYDDLKKNGLVARCVVGCLEVIAIIILCIESPEIQSKHWMSSGSYVNGYLLNFCISINELIIEKPEGYDLDVIKKTEALVIQETGNGVRPHVLVLVDESFSDLNVLGDNLRTNKDVIPFWDSLHENCIKGYALSSVYGGNTPNSEYEFLTCNSLAFLPQNDIPYQQHIKGDCWSIVRLFEELGYTTLATHPFTANSWMRPTVYPRLGFSNCSFEDAYPKENLLRDYVSDYEMFNYLLNQLKGADSPQFIFGVTMQNHGSYLIDDYESDIKLVGYDNSYPDAEQYLSIIHQTDLALEFLIQKLKSLPYPVVLVFYGDHFPSLNTNFLEEIHGKKFVTLEEQILKYKIPFLIWANYDIEEENVNLTSINYLSNYLFDVTGLPMPAYNQITAKIQDVIPALCAQGYYSAEDNRFKQIDEATGYEKEIMDYYRIIQYNNIFDSENRSDILFPITGIKGQ